MNNNTNKMGTSGIPKLMLSMGLPMILSMMVQAFYNIVDSYFVSNMKDTAEIAHIGDYAINALTLCFPVQMLMIAIGVGTGIGVNSLLSKSLGEGNRKKTAKIAGNAVFAGICTYIVFLLFGIFGTEAFLRTQTSDEIVLMLGNQYLSICTIISFGAIGSMIYEKLLQSSGKTVLSTAAQLAGAIANIILDPIMIYGLLGCPEMGIVGAALATVIGQIITLILGMIFHYTLNKEIPSGFRYIIPDNDALAGIYKVGAPAILMQALMSVMSYGINIIFGSISAAAVTAFGIYYKVQQFVFFAAFGMNNVIIPIVAFNFGMGDNVRVKGSIRWGIIYTLALMLIGAAALQIFASPISAAFHLAPDSERLCVTAMHIVTLGYLFAGANIAFQGIFQALGNGMRSLIVSLIRLIIVTLPLAWIFSHLSDAETIAWAAFPVAEACGLVCSLIFMRKTDAVLTAASPSN